MRILTILKHLGPGGAERAAQNFATGYRAAGHDSAVLAYVRGGVREDELRQANIPCFIGSEEEEGRNAALKKAIEWAPDALHIHRHGLPDPQSASVLRSIQTSLGGHLPTIETNVFGKPDHTSDRQLIDVHLPKTRWAFWKWSQWTRHLEPRPIGAVVPNTTDPDRFYPASEEDRIAFRREHGIPKDAFVFGCVGQPDPNRWPPIVFDAFSEVARRRRNCYYLVAGVSDGARKVIAGLPDEVRSRIVVVPFIHGDDRLRTCYSSMDVFLHASLMGESFGMVFVEALLCGVPVITLNRPAKGNSQLEVVGHERGGLLVNDKRSMIEAMHRLMDDAPLRGRLAREGARHVRSHYTLDQAIPLLLRIIETIRATSTREELRNALKSDPTLITDVSRSEIRNLLGNTMGRIPLNDLILMKLVHQPVLFRIWNRLKFGI